MFLLPAGTPAALKAAVINKADAVYFGIGEFNARKRAQNFDFQTTKSAVDFAHEYKVKVFVTCNITFYENELSSLYKFLYLLSHLNVDGIIIQDFAVYEIAEKYFKNKFRYASSTQMNVNNIYAVNFLEQNGFSQIILARELTWDEIEFISKNSSVTIEIFAHGAMCYSYSGLCYLSSNMGGRSGNRGDCAQPCRLEYSLDGKKGYYLSSKDLCLIDEVEKNKKDFYYKIEGRLKSEDYVAACTKAYKNSSDKELLELIYHRPYGKGHFIKKGHKDFVDIENSPKKGAFLCKAFKRQDFYELVPKFDLKLGDKFFVEDNQGNSFGYIIKSMHNTKGDFIKHSPAKKTVRLKFPSKKNTLEVFLNSSHLLSNDYKDDFSRSPFICVKTELTITNNNTVNIKTEDNFEFSTFLELEKPVKSATDKINIKKHFEKKAPSQFFYFEITNINYNEDFFIKASSLNNARNIIMENYEKFVFDKKFKFDSINKSPKLCAKVFNMNQLDYSPVNKNDFDILYLSAKNIKEFDSKIIPWIPPVLDSDFTDYEKVILNLKNLGYKKLLIGDSGGLQLGLKHDFEVIADSFMNITNSQAMEFYGKNGVKRICLSYELGSDSLSELGSYKNIQTELLVYGKKVSMISANCILFNTGECKEKTGCSQNFQIKDSKDNVLDVICADCKNYIFHSKLTDFRKENLKADYLRYDLTGF
ncbi:MAG: DUF3656 domain-containing protein [Candidatus Muiribacteriota bacterium]